MQVIATTINPTIPCPACAQDSFLQARIDRTGLKVKANPALGANYAFALSELRLVRREHRAACPLCLAWDEAQSAPSPTFDSPMARMVANPLGVAQ